MQADSNATGMENNPTNKLPHPVGVKPPRIYKRSSFPGTPRARQVPGSTFCRLVEVREAIVLLGQAWVAISRCPGVEFARSFSFLTRLCSRVGLLSRPAVVCGHRQRRVCSPIGSLRCCGLAADDDVAELCCP